MQLESPAIPHSLLQVLWLVLASSLGWIGGWLTRRRREPAEIAKLNAETRQVSVSTDVSLIQAATQAIAGAERLRSQCEHWERKATDVMLDLEDERRLSAQQATRLTLHEYQMKRLKGLLDAHGISYSEIDKPRSSDCA
jgi:hypothetical protein